MAAFFQKLKKELVSGFQTVDKQFYVLSTSTVLDDRTKVDVKAEGTYFVKSSSPYMTEVYVDLTLSFPHV